MPLSDFYLTGTFNFSSIGSCMPILAELGDFVLSISRRPLFFLALPLL
jgi:hypothetical protein